MHTDDRSIGRLLSRRELVGLFGASATAAMAGRVMAQPSHSGLGTPDCVAQPQQTEGPYFVDEQLRRSDIRLDPATGQMRDGAPLELIFLLSQITSTGACAVLQGAQVDIWHCDAQGIYSDVRNRRVDTTGQKFLRGYQLSDADGLVRFTTIYPGWYPGRAVHVHFKIRVPAGAGRSDEFTSQLYFDDAMTDRVHTQVPYAVQRGQRLLNERDMIFREGGTQLILPVHETAGNYAATYRIAMRSGEARTRRLGFGGRERRS